MATFNRIGVLAHPLRPQTAPIADEIAAYLQARGVEAWHDAQLDDAQVRARGKQRYGDCHRRRWFDAARGAGIVLVWRTGAGR